MKRPQQPKRIATTDDFKAWCDSREMSARTANGLGNMLPCRFFGQKPEPFTKWMRSHRPIDMLKIRNFGKKSLAEFADLVYTHRKDHPEFRKWLAQLPKSMHRPPRNLKAEKRRERKDRLRTLENRLLKANDQINRQANQLDVLMADVSSIKMSFGWLTRMSDDVKALGVMVYALDMRTKHFNPTPPNRDTARTTNEC